MRVISQSERVFVRFFGLMLAVVALASACSSNDTQDTPSDTRADAVVSSALANSQGGAMEVVRYFIPGDGDSGLNTNPLPPAMAATINLASCEQIDIVRWRLAGTVELLDSAPVEGVLQFQADTTNRIDFLARVSHSGSFDIEVPTTSLSDLATTCALLFPDSDSWTFHTQTRAVAYDGVFTWDAEPGTVASLGVGLIAGERSDPRRAWAQQHWFGEDLPFDRVLASDRTLVGVPRVHEVDSRDVFESPCQEITLTYVIGEVTQRQSCTPEHVAPLTITPRVNAEWERHGVVEGLVFEDRGREYLIGSAGGWQVEIVGQSVGDVVTLASTLTFYSNDSIREPIAVPGQSSLPEDAIADQIIGVEFREVGRIDTAVGRFLVIEGPLNPENPSDYLRQLRIYRLAKLDVYWNPVLVAGGKWDRCLGTAVLGEVSTFIVTGESDATVERSDGADLGELDRAGRIRLAPGSYPTSALRLRVDGTVVVCVEPVETTLPSVVPTTTGTLPGTTDDTTPPGSTDTTSP